LTGMNIQNQRRMLRLLGEALRISRSDYEKATERYESIGQWFLREKSTIRALDPRVYPQGSFRYGTVTPSPEGYDLDLVCELGRLTKLGQSQQDVKRLIGNEVRAYASAHAMKAEPEAKRRCWHLDYADKLHFHLDIVPAVPEESSVKAEIRRLIELRHGAGEWADPAIAITDETTAAFSRIARDWPMSNPDGYARWFESRMHSAAIRLLERGQKIEDIPAYAWNTPLQTAILILKQHRDQMFENDPDNKPVSIIISSLAALAYEGQDDLREALVGIVGGLAEHLEAVRPRLPNPANPGEDFTDRWLEDPAREQAFWTWHRQVVRDLERLGHDLPHRNLQEHLFEKFGVKTSEDEISRAFPSVGAVVVPTASGTAKTRQWGV